MLALGGIAAAACGQPVICVDQSAEGHGDGNCWKNPFADLQSALDAAEASDSAITEIWVAAGVYTPTKRTNPDDPRSATFHLLNGVAVYGGFDGTESYRSERDPPENRTILTGDLANDDGIYEANIFENAYHVVTASGTRRTAVLDGVTISRGHANAVSLNAGAGILNISGNPTIRSCLIRWNRAGWRGGGMYNAEGSSPRIVDCEFQGNRVGWTANTSQSLARATTTPYGGGGGMYNVASSPVISGCTFAGNESDRWAGAIYNTDSTVTFLDCSFRSNIAELGGGAITILGGDPVSFLGCRFDYNSCREVGCFGGAVACWDATITLSACYFLENRAGRGGGVFARVYAAELPPKLIIDHTTFEGNSAEDGGAVHSLVAETSVSNCHFLANVAASQGGAYFDGGDNALIKGCIFEDNRAELTGGGLARYGRFTEVLGSQFLDNHAGSGGGITWGGEELLLDSCQFEKNSAAEGGAADLFGDDVTIKRTIFRSNRATQGGAVRRVRGRTRIRESRFHFNLAADGGGLWLEETEAIVRDSLFHWNKARVGGAVSQSMGSLDLLNCTLVQNAAGALGGGVITGRGTTISNTVLWQNYEGDWNDRIVDELAQIAGGHLVTIDYSIVDGWTGQYGGIGNSGIDPMFIDADGPDDRPGTMDDDLHLLPDSPAINAGDPNLIVEAGQGDLDGHARILYGRVDIGAYEFGIGDYDGDRVAEPEDFAAWDACMTGPGAGPYQPGCEAFDFDADLDVDAADFAGFQTLRLPP